VSTMLQDGSVLYRYPDDIADVTLDGVSVLNLLVEEICVHPDGYGYVLVQKELGQSGKPVKEWVDGQTRNHQLWGRVEVTL